MQNGVPRLVFFFPPLLFSRRRSIDTGLFYWAASRHRLFLYWPVSRCACGREGVRPDLPLPGWEATGKHGGGRVRKEVAERWKVSVLVVVRREIFEEQAGRKGSSCRMGKESRPTGDEGRAGFLVARRLNVEIYGNAHQVFEVQMCTICVDQFQNGPPKSPQNQKKLI